MDFEDAEVYCVDELGLVDDPDLTDDNYDLCLIEFTVPEQLPVVETEAPLPDEALAGKSD